jgi:hypothetical protein
LRTEDFAFDWNRLVLLLFNRLAPACLGLPQGDDDRIDINKTRLLVRPSQYLLKRGQREIEPSACP